MGGRLSVPSGPGGMTETSRPSPKAQRFRLNSRTVIAPLSTLLLASLFFIYSRTTIRAAKVNAQRHRDADGGSISWRNEALRRHGALEKPEERTLWGQLWAGNEGGTEEGATGKGDGGKGDGSGTNVGKGGRETEGMRRRRVEVNPIEEGIRRARERGGGGRGGGKGEGEE